ncbi:putative phospholipase B-like 2 isoform X2 [Latimeria chalumnae]|uniref:putative phospholipase B-like 2 isoform X2 n=1 Tax=Latimeria chalumnae TaxID=7897 RepID=UPI00313B103C
MEQCGRAAAWLISLFLIFQCLCKLSSCGSLSRDKTISSVIIQEGTGRLKVVPGLQPDFVAWASFTDNIQKTGWSYLEVVTNGRYNDSVQAYAAGVVEAAVTQQLIYMHWMNTMVGYCGPFKYEKNYCDRLKSYIATNLAWMEEQIEAGEDQEYWHQVRLVLLQLKGLEDSYNEHLAFPTGKFSLEPFGFLLFQMGGDLEDLEMVLNKTKVFRPLGAGSCSALIKLLPGNKELLVSHDTWLSYQYMLRIVKKYTFAFRTSPEALSGVPGNVQSFSSYPGTIFSGDDFYILSSGMVTLETTIGNSNPALWKYVRPEGAVMEWLRNIVANRLAKSGMEWATVFKKFNSGTYNNQWLIVDYNYFTPGKSDIKENLFTVLEQIPQVAVADKTQELLQKGYWASYNIPYFEEIFNASGIPELVQKYGDWFTFDKNPRAQIFHRNQTLVKDMDSMIRLMRYNNFRHDPLSKCQGCNPPYNGENAISARSDLNPANGTYPFGALKQRLHGGIDMKVTSFEMHKSYQMKAISGPTWDQVLPFQWSKSPYDNLTHMGHPDLWEFPVVWVQWK